MSKLNKRIIKNIQEIKKFNISVPLQLRILSIILGIKPNLTIEYFNKKYFNEIKKISIHFNIHHKLIQYPKFTKLIMGIKKEEVDELFSLEDQLFYTKDVCKDAHTSLKDDGGAHYRYGILMGYPKCCCLKMLEPKTYQKLDEFLMKRKIKINFNSKDIQSDIKLRNSSGAYLLTHNPWSWDTCFFNGLIYHLPCSPHCKSTKKFANQHMLLCTLMIYQTINLRKEDNPVYEREILLLIKKSLILNNTGYLLHFARNLYCLFSAIKRGNYFHIKKVINNRIDPHVENTDRSMDFTKQSRLLSKVNNDSKLKIDETNIKLINKRQTYTYKKIDFSDGCVIEFK